MAGEKILVVEDEPDILELHRYNLNREGYRVITAVTGDEAIVRARSENPDLILLDLLLPGKDGLEVCHILKQERSLKSIAIIMVTARGEDADIIKGLELGADDYVTKPFSPRVLTARIRSVLRKRKNFPQTRETDKISIHGIAIDPARFSVYADGRPVELTATEFALLMLFAENPGIVLSRSRIINAVKGDDYAVTERSVDVQILGIRKKLGSKGKYIKTVRGIGYRFKDEE